MFKPGTSTFEMRDLFARKTARRTLVAEKGNETKALARLKVTVVWRADMQMDDLVKCFPQTQTPAEHEDDSPGGGDGDDGKKQVYTDLREGLKDQMEDGKVYCEDMTNEVVLYI
jgi:hypothetical protein